MNKIVPMLMQDTDEIQYGRRKNLVSADRRLQFGHYNQQMIELRMVDNTSSHFNPITVLFNSTPVGRA